MAQEIRAFIAIELKEETRKKLREIQSELRKLIRSKVSWPKPENIHLTLKFLGDVSIEQVSSIKEELKQINKSFSHFNMSLGGIGAFPNFRNPRVIWLGITTGNEEVIQIATQIDKTTNKLGFPLEKREFTPHLTLGRIKQRVNLENIEPKFTKYDKLDMDIPVDRFALIKSELNPRGAIYTTLEEFILGK